MGSSVIMKPLPDPLLNIKFSIDVLNSPVSLRVIGEFFNRLPPVLSHLDIHHIEMGLIHLFLTKKLEIPLDSDTNYKYYI